MNPIVEHLLTNSHFYGMSIVFILYTIIFPLNENINNLNQNFMNRSENEINEQLDLANDHINEGSKFPGMSYEDGVKNTIDWMLGHVDEKPMND